MKRKTKKHDLNKFSKINFIDLITKLNIKIMYLQRQKWKVGAKWRSIEYKRNIAKEVLLKFLHKDIEHPMDQAPCAKDRTVQELRTRLETKYK